ncbi:NifB/NifX family molybdenum-iron cluster-binding protein [bacterium]|nr:NifB/NifX family molybdenum-iron cluster-binding protein [bacterium]
MKAAIACDGTRVSQHFGRCEKYLVAELDGTDTRSVQWLANAGHEHGVLPEVIRREGVQVVVAGGAGPRAQQLLAEYGVQMILGASGDALEVLQALAQGTLQPGASSCDHSKCDHTGCNHTG